MTDMAGDDLSAIRERLDAARTPFELSRCHFELHAYLRDHPESRDGKRLLKRIDEMLASTATKPPAKAHEPRPLAMALRPIPWAVAAIVIVYVILQLIGRRH